MKKSIIFILLVIAGFLALSFISLKKETKTVKPDSTVVTWKGYKVTGSHTGTVDLTSGLLEFEGETLSGGEFTLDMKSISCTDLEGEGKSGLEGHLKSDDFFGVESHKKLL